MAATTVHSQAHVPEGVQSIAIALAQWSVRYRILVFILSLAVLIAGAAGTLQLSFDPDARVYFSSDSAERLAFEQFEERYGRRQNLIVIAIPDVASNEAARSLALAVADKIDGAEGTGPILKEPDDSPRSLELHETGVGSVLATFEVPLTAAGDEVHRTVKALEQIADEIVGGSGAQILFTGNPAQVAASMDAILGDLLFLVPIQVAIIVMLLLLFTGSLLATIVLLSVLAVATSATMGGFGWLGGSLNGVTSATPSALLGLSVATSVHLMFGWQGALRLGFERGAALRRTVGLHIVPVMIATVTTIISFLFLNLADSPAFHTFGTLVATGLGLTFILSFTLLPALLSLLPAPRHILGRDSLEAVLAGLARFVVRAKVLVLLTAIGVIGLSIWGVGKVVFEDRFTAYFDNSYPYSQATQLYEDQIGGVTPVLFSLPRREGESLAGPDYTSRVATFTRWLETQPSVSEVRSLSTLLKDDPTGRSGAVTMDGVTVSPRVAGFLEEGLRGQSDDGDLQWLLGRTFADEASGEGATKVLAMLRYVSSADIIAFAERAGDKLNEVAPGPNPVPTGLPVLGAQLSERNGQAMIRATPLALAAISVILIFALRSLRLGLASLLPNLLPLLMAYGAWGMVMGELTFAGTMVIAMTFGIVVDDTVHMMARYRYLRREGMAPPQAMEGTFRSVGIAVFATTVAIATGYIALGFSGFVVNRDLGLITATTLFGALLSVTVFLPALIAIIDRGGQSR
ncbi:MAG: MMPL family transporter [Pseudomonadota bacterium]